MPPPQGGPPGLPCLEGLSQSLSITSPCFISIPVLFLLEMIFFMCLLSVSPVRPLVPKSFLSFFPVYPRAPCLQQCPAHRRCARNICGSKAEINACVSLCREEGPQPREGLRLPQGHAGGRGVTPGAPLSPGLRVSGSPCLLMRAVGPGGQGTLVATAPSVSLLMSPLPAHLPSQCPGWASLQPWQVRAGVAGKMLASCQVSPVFLKLPSRK